MSESNKSIFRSLLKKSGYKVVSRADSLLVNGSEGLYSGELMSSLIRASADTFETKEQFHQFADYLAGVSIDECAPNRDGTITLMFVLS